MHPVMLQYQISAFTTAKKTEDGTGPIQSEQTKQINGGEAAFTLILPMSVEGWPHVSFYPADNGGDFGGIYFGTGDSVLKKWWGTEAAESANQSSKPTWSDADRERFHRFEKAIKDVEIVIALFNDKDGFYPALDETHKQLAQHERSLYTYGLKADPSSVEAKRFNLTSAPTCIVFRSGKELSRLTPIQSSERLQKFVSLAVGTKAKNDSTETTIATHKVPKPILRNVLKWAELKKLKYEIDDKTDQVILQAPQDLQTQFRELVEAANKWYAPDAVAERKRTMLEKFNERGLQDRGQLRLKWSAMGLTFGPPKEVDSPHTRPTPISGVEVVSVEPGSAGACLTIEPKDIVTNVSTFKSTSLSELESIIDAVARTSDRTMHTITVFKPSGEFFQTYLPLNNSAVTTVEFLSSSDQSSTKASSSTKNTKFPSLEDQKLADLAYKRLGLELEPIGEADLKRVKALGYEGGVKVVSGSAGLQGQDERIQANDLLVGLHVWPTTNMKEVAEILDRGDLDELNPLKFYIVRNEQTGPPTKENPNESSFRDVVHTGRLNVNLGGNGFGGGKRQIEKPKQAGHPDDQSGNNPYTTKPRPPVAVESSSGSASASASPEELDILRDRIKIAEEQFKYIDEQFKIGGKAGSKDRYEIAAYELALAQANLATAEGKRDEDNRKVDRCPGARRGGLQSSCVGLRRRDACRMISSATRPIDWRKSN